MSNTLTALTVATKQTATITTIYRRLTPQDSSGDIHRIRAYSTCYVNVIYSVHCGQISHL